MAYKHLTEVERECAELLRLPEDLSEDRARKLMNTRLHALGHSSPCGRCGGSGRYSFNPMDGSMCYGCGGSGGKPPRITKALVAAVWESVAAGRLDDYLERIRCLRAANTAQKRVMEAWHASGVSSHYSWLKASKGIEPDRSLADLINNPMSDAYNAVSAETDKLQRLNIRLRKAETAEQKKAIEEERADVSRSIVELADRAVETIEVLAEKIPEVRKEAILGMKGVSPRETDTGPFPMR